MRELSGTIAVLMGGPSAERSISLKSGQAVVEALTSRGHRVAPVVLEPMETTAAQLATKLHAVRAEVAFLALHGTFGEDGTLQTILEQLGMPYTGSGPEASRWAFDKWASRQRFLARDIPVPPTVHLTRDEAQRWQRTLDGFHRREWTQPLVVKPVRQGSSMGVTRVASPTELAHAMDVALQLDDAVLIETWIQGRELTIAMFDEQALPVVEIRTTDTFFDYQAKYHASSTEYLVPAPLDEVVTLRVQQTALAAYRALGCRHFARVDVILSTDGTPVILEVNTIPGLTSRSLLPMAAQACGCGFPELCEHMVALALETPPALVAAASGPA